MNQPQTKLFGIALLILAAALGLGGFLCLKRPARYQATATVKVERDKADLPELGPGAAAGLDNTYFVQTEIELIHSEAILGKVIIRLDLNRAWGKQFFDGQTLRTAETVQLLKGRLRSQPVPGAALINISANSADAEEAANLANAAAQAYCEYRVESRRRLAQSALDTLTNKFMEMERNIAVARAKLAQAGQQLDPALRDQAAANGSPEGENETLRKLHRRYSESVLRCLAQSNQFAAYKPADADAEEIAKQLAARAEQARAEMLAAETTIRDELRKQDLVRDYQAAQLELEETTRLFAPLKKAVDGLQNDLHPQGPAPAQIVEPATVPTRAETQGASRGRLFLAGGAVALALGFGLLLLGPKLSRTAQ